MSQALRAVCVVLVATLVMTLGGHGAIAAETVLSAEREPIPAGVEVQVEELGEGDAVVSTDLEDASGVEGAADVLVVDDEVAGVLVEATLEDGEVIEDVFLVDDFVLAEDGEYSVTLRSASTDEVAVIDESMVSQQALPAILVLIAKVGVSWAIRTIVYNSARKYALGLAASRWAHILASKHNWAAIGGTSKTKVADLMAKAVANGSRHVYKNHIDYVWKYNSRYNVVTRTSRSGHISNGWVTRR